jgi:hypothetical protein
MYLHGRSLPNRARDQDKRLSKHQNGNTNMRRGFHHPTTITVKIAMHFSLINLQTLVTWVAVTATDTDPTTAVSHKVDLKLHVTRWRKVLIIGNCNSQLSQQGIALSELTCQIVVRSSGWVVLGGLSATRK